LGCFWGDVLIFNYSVVVIKISNLNARDVAFARAKFAIEKLSISDDKWNNLLVKSNDTQQIFDVTIMTANNSHLYPRDTKTLPTSPLQL